MFRRQKICLLLLCAATLTGLPAHAGLIFNLNTFDPSLSAFRGQKPISRTLPISWRMKVFLALLNNVTLNILEQWTPPMELALSSFEKQRLCLYLRPGARSPRQPCLYPGLHFRRQQSASCRPDGRWLILYS